MEASNNNVVIMENEVPVKLYAFEGEQEAEDFFVKLILEKKTETEKDLKRYVRQKNYSYTPDDDDEEDNNYEIYLVPARLGNRNLNGHNVLEIHNGEITIKSYTKKTEAEDCFLERAMARKISYEEALDRMKKGHYQDELFLMEASQVSRFWNTENWNEN